MSKLYVNEIFPQSGDTVKISGSLEFQAGENLIILGAEGGAAALTLKADEGDDATDVVKFSVADGGTLTIVGNDAGASINALVVDMSDAGHAKFNSHVSASGDVYALGSISGSNNLTIGGNIHASGSITCDVLNVNEINSTSKTVNTLEIVDKVILAASGSYPNNSNGAGFQVGGHSTGSAGTDIAVTFFYNSTNNSMDLSTTFSSSGDVYALGSISGSNNLAVGGNAEVSGTLSASLVYAHAVANAQSFSSITIPANYNSVLYGPISVNVDETVTIGVDSNVAIVDIADV